MAKSQNVSILDFTGAKDDGDGGVNWSCKTCKAPVKSSAPTNQRQTIADRRSRTTHTVFKALEDMYFGRQLLLRVPEHHQYHNVIGVVARIAGSHRCRPVDQRQWKLLHDGVGLGVEDHHLRVGDDQRHAGRPDAPLCSQLPQPMQRLIHGHQCLTRTWDISTECE